MKKSTPLLLGLLSLFSLSAQAAHQYIQCAPADRESDDRAVVALWPNQEGTLFLSSNLDTDESSGVIQMRKVPGAQTSELLVLGGENESSAFKVSIPASAFWKRSDDLRIRLELIDKQTHSSFTDELLCFSRVYTD